MSHYYTVIQPKSDLFPCCEPADCEVFEVRSITFSDAEMEEVSRIIRDYKEKRK